MKKLLLITIPLSLSLIFPTSSRGENIEHLQQLLNSKQCQNCDLIDAGLVMANLKGANLRGANLRGANLSRVDLTGADLTGADLTNASLFGANLSNVNLTNANLSGTDLRQSSLQGAKLDNVDLSYAYLQGAIGIPTSAFTAKQFYLLAMEEDKKGNYPQAISYYNQALEIDSDLAPAYLAKAVIKSRYGDVNSAIAEAKTAKTLFEKQNNQEGSQLSTNFITLVETRADLEAEAKKKGGNKGNSGFVNAINSVIPFVFKLFAF